MFHNFQGFFNHIHHIDRNIRLYLLTTLLINLGFGVFQTDFNLYILSMGITPDFLGIILSLTPFAQALASIPIGFMAEKIGYKRALILVNSIVGCAYVLRVISPNPVIIMAGALLTGVMACGYFIIQFPFISHYAGKQKNQSFVLTSMVFYTALSAGSLLGGFLPDLVNSVVMDETVAYRLVLIGFSALVILGTIPLFFLDDDKPDGSRKISLSPYLTNIDGNTARFAAIELFIGAGLAFLLFFMNIIFIFYYKASLEFFGSVSALLIVPTIFFLFFGPVLAEKYSGFKIILVSRFMASLFALVTVLTTNPFFGAGAYILFRSLMSLVQSLWFAFAASVTTRRSRMATSAWLEITFQIGLGIAALAGGKLIAGQSYMNLGIFAASSLLISFILTALFFGKQHLHNHHLKIRDNI